jgi:hypothetical protein
VLRVLTLCLIALVGLVSFVYGFGVLMSHGWDSVDGQRVSAETWQLLPPLTSDSGIGLLDRGIAGTLTTFQYEVAGQTYLAPQWALVAESEPSAEVHYLSFVPQVAVPSPHFPWATLFAIPLLCCLLALLLTRSRQLTAALRATTEARARIASRKAVMR